MFNQNPQSQVVLLNQPHFVEPIPGTLIEQGKIEKIIVRDRIVKHPDENIEENVNDGVECLVYMANDTHPSLMFDAKDKAEALAKLHLGVQSNLFKG